MRACRVWEQLRNSDLPPPEDDVAKWEAQFNQLMNSQREDPDFDYGGMMQNAWDGMGSADFSPEPPLQFNDQGIPALGDYVFGASSLYASVCWFSPIRMYINREGQPVPGPEPFEIIVAGGQRPTRTEWIAFRSRPSPGSSHPARGPG